jgi:glucose-1-phosphate cytidylyltransferase
MKVIILAGGYGTRLSEETDQKPKPMVEIGGQPMLWHIMNIYSACGFKEFIIAAGYKQEIIQKYVTKTPVAGCKALSVDTGLQTGTGGRLKKLSDLIGKETFLMTYGDGLANIDIKKLLNFHRQHGKLATITAVRPPARFGALQLDGQRVTQFEEKPQAGEGWINGGFFVLEPKVLDYIANDEIMFEQEPLMRLSKDGQLMAYQHADFWHCMDTLRDLRLLDGLWTKGEAPWKIWE